jgi:hypothetical protein
LYQEQESALEQKRLPPELQVLADDPLRYGLRLLPSLPEGPSSDNSYELSVVAVHGLGGDFYRTWATSGSQRQILWLSQLLPKDLPGARIFSFGYESAPTFSRSVTGIRDSANGLLHHLKSIIEQVSENPRAYRTPILTNPQWPDQPIIFICHSLGGIIVKQVPFLG